MLKRIYINNFRCFVNFELSLREINLFMGVNGTGKSTVFEVLRKLQAYITRKEKVDKIFKISDCTNWLKSPLQTFELEIEGNEGHYKYKLEIKHSFPENSTIVQDEKLFFNEQLLEEDTYPTTPVEAMMSFESNYCSLREENEKKTKFLKIK